MKELLIELLSEEIPARMQESASADFESLVTDSLLDNGLKYESKASFYTPRRLVLVVTGLTEKSPKVITERRGPRSNAPDKAINGFLKSTGLSLEQLEIRSVKGSEFYFAKTEQKGRSASEIVSETLENTIVNFPWPKTMRWGEGALKWIRPLHNVLCILSDENESKIVDFNFCGFKANNKSRGHRFRGNVEFSVKNFDDLKQKLRKSYVLLDQEDRKKDIVNSASNLAFAIGLEVVEDQLLLNEVKNLVEWPNVLVGKISEEYLGLPSDVLQVSMRKHQKFFSLKNKINNYIEGFVIVSNNETSDNGKLILEGNQKVLLARLSDAKFFLENDLRLVKLGMNSWVEELKEVTYHHKLGSQFERVERIQKKSSELAEKLGVDKKLVDKASLYSKADLMSEMVNEFPELQGKMGCYYANFCDFHPEISLAIEEHYSPMGPNDECPKALVSVVLALSDKLDILESFWKIDQKPTGSKDPFALRRAALGVIRLLLENQISLQLRSHVSELDDRKVNDLLSFFHERFKIFLRDKKIRHDIIDACLSSSQNDDFYTLFLKAETLSHGFNSKIGRDLFQGFKRANNILKKAETKDSVSYELEPDSRFFETNAEKKLLLALEKTNEVIVTKLLKNDFRAAFNILTDLRIPIDNFFNTVKVNSDSTIIRRNRLCLLHKIRLVCNKVADFNLIEG